MTKPKRFYLQEWRLYRQKTLKELEDLTGIGFRNLSKYEREDIAPKITQVERIAQALGLELTDLFHPPPDFLLEEESRGDTAHV